MPGMMRKAQDGAAEGQQAAVREFFERNGCIGYDQAERMGVSPRGLRALLLGEVGLEGCLVSRAVLNQMDSAVEDCLSHGQWLNIHDVVPEMLRLEDATSLMGHCCAIANLSKTGRGSVMGGSCVVNTEFLETLGQRCAYEAKAAARLAAFGSRDGRAAVREHPADSQQQGQGSAATGGDSMPRCNLADELFDLHMAPSKGRKRGKDAKRVQKSFSAKPGRDDGTADAKGQKPQAPKKARPSVRSLASKIMQWYPDTDSLAGDEDQLAELLSRAVLDQARHEFELELEACWSAGSEENMAPLRRLVEMQFPDGTASLVEMAWQP